MNGAADVAARAEAEGARQPNQGTSMMGAKKLPGGLT
jgi:hypothetical protein